MSSARKPASRYGSFDSQSSTPSSSTDLKLPNLKSFRNNAPAHVISRTKNNTDAAIIKVNNNNNNNKVSNEHNFASMVKKFMEKRSSSNSNSTSKSRQLQLVIPPDLIAEDAKKTARKPSNLAALPKKLFGKGGSTHKKTRPALTEVNTNTRTLSMVLRSERELLSLNKDHEIQIAHLNSLLQERNQEVEKLKDLCLKQREEIKALKSAILFPDEMNSQLHVLLEKQGSELKQAKQVIPTLQRQISSLTGQLQSLTEDVAEVKAVKYSARSWIDGSFCSPGTLVYNQEEAANSLDFRSDDDHTPDMLLEDMNPCLTPCYSKIKSKEYKATCYANANDEEANAVKVGERKMSRSSDRFTSFRAGSSSTTRAHAAFCRSDESKYRYGNQIDHQLL